MLVDAVEPRWQPTATCLHICNAQAREALEHAVHDHREQRALRLVWMHDGVPFRERVEAIGARARRVQTHVLVGREGAVEILEKLVYRVVVAVAEVAVVELVGPRPEAPDAERVVAELDLFDGSGHVGERYGPRGQDAAARRVPHFLAPAVVGPGHSGLELGVDPFEPHVVLGSVDHHQVDAFDGDRPGDSVAREAVGDDLGAVFGDHVLGGPVDGLLELSVDRRGVLGPAAVDGDRVVVVEAGRAPAADPVAVLLVEEAGPEVRWVDDVGVGVEDLEPVSHRALLGRRFSTADPTKRALGWPGAPAQRRSTHRMPNATAVDDAITGEIIRRGLLVAAEEASVVVVRASHSTFSQEGADACAAILDPAGQLVAQSTATSLMHGASLRSSLPSLLEQCPLDSMQTGDVFALNDPYRGGIHANDILVFRPVFGDGRVAFFAGTLIHVADLGGNAVAGLGSLATDTFAEGLSLPPVRLYRNGEPADDVLRIIAGNSRAPDKVIGD